MAEVPHVSVSPCRFILPFALFGNHFASLKVPQSQTGLPLRSAALGIGAHRDRSKLV